MSFHNHDTDDYKKKYEPSKREPILLDQKITEFDVSEIEDVRIIIKAKGKHFGIVPKGDKEEARLFRIAILMVFIKDYQVVNTALEDLKEKL